MQSKGSNARLSGMASRSRIPSLLLFMFSTFSTIYVAGRLALFFNCFIVFPFEFALFTVKFLTFFFFWVGVVYRLWQDSENRVYLIKELDRITGKVGISCFGSILLLCGCFGILFIFVYLGL